MFTIFPKLKSDRDKDLKAQRELAELLQSHSFALQGRRRNGIIVMLIVTIQSLPDIKTTDVIFCLL